MRIRTIGVVAAALAIAVAPTISEAQGQRQGRERAPRVQRGMMVRGGGQMGQAVGAEYFLARSAQLGLTDQQVVQLAAIARRAESRREAARENMPMMPGMRMGPGTGMGPGARMTPRAEGRQPADSAARAAARQARSEAMQRVRAAMTEMRAQREADLRDAIAVLTPEQQATAWRTRGRR